MAFTRDAQTLRRSSDVLWVRGAAVVRKERLCNVRGAAQGCIECAAMVVQGVQMGMGSNAPCNTCKCTAAALHSTPHQR